MIATYRRDYDADGSRPSRNRGAFLYREQGRATARVTLHTDDVTLRNTRYNPDTVFPPFITIFTRRIA